jgi:hypothetical protein
VPTMYSATQCVRNSNDLPPKAGHRTPSNGPRIADPNTV